MCYNNFMKTHNHIFFNIKNGFTLAEVLITLVIIGVVAALAISPLINTYVESSTVAKVKKGLSIIGQAKKLAELQNGSIEGWDFGETTNEENITKLFNYLKPHLSLAKDCGTNPGCYQNDVYYLKGVIASDAHYENNSNYYKFVLADGSVMVLAKYPGKCNYNDRYGTLTNIINVCAGVVYDVNGDKSPNTLGKDVFVYNISTDGVYPLDYPDCSKNRDGWGCAGYIIQHNNMKYLH